MFFIFGFGKRTTKDMGTAGKVRCSNCGNIREWRNVKVTTWFSLFFIPVIPYKAVYLKECPVCKGVVLLNKEDIVENSNNTSQNTGSRKTSSTSKTESLKNSELTDVQRNYRENMEAVKKNAKS